jgi:hypothetical protein
MKSFHFNITSSGHCCGSKDLECFGNEDGVWNPEYIIYSLVREIATYAQPYKGDSRVAGYAFYNMVTAYNPDESYRKESKSVQLGKINRFKRFVEKHGLGSVTIAPDCGNPNYVGRHVLRPGVWVADNAGIIKYAVKKRWIKQPSKHAGATAHICWAQQGIADIIWREEY